LVAALEQITGRQVTLNGPVKIRWSLTPAIQASNISIANPPGFPDRDVLTLGRLRAEIALLPLFSDRVDILKLVLVAPHLTLERSPDGNADWDFSTARSHPITGAMPFLDSRIKVALEAVEVEDGLLTIKTNNNTLGVVHFNKLIGTAATLSAPLHLSAQAAIGTTPFDITGIVGPIERFSGIGNGPWPLDLDFTMAGAKLNIAGTVERPRDASGYDLTVNLSIPDLNTLGQTLPPSLTDNLPLPSIQNIEAAAHLKDSDAALPAISDLTITAGPSDLSALRPGLMLNALNAKMLTLDQSFSITASGTSGSGAFTLQSQFGAVEDLFPPAWLPDGTTPAGSFPISIAAQLGDANASVTGAIATPQTLSGAALALTASIPDLSALSSVAGMQLPAWKNISMQTSLIDPGGEGLHDAAGLDSLTVTMDNAAFGGDATLNFTPQPTLQLALTVTQANMDALLAAFPKPAAPIPPPTAPAPAAPPAPNTLVIPDTPLPLGFLSWGKANIQLAANNVVWNGASFTGLQANAELSDKKLTINPLTGQIPGGGFTATASLDASSTPASETLSIKAPALALGPLLKALNLNGTADGNLQVQFTAASTGNTLRAIAADLNGQLGVASVNDQIDADILNQAYGAAEKVAGLPPPANGATAIRCIGLRIDTVQGVATLKTFGIDSNQLFLQGTGSVDLGNETFNVTLQPVNGTQILLGGSFAQPTLTAPPQAVSPPPAPPSGTAQRPDICPAMLALARIGQAGPVALSPSPPAPAPTSGDAGAPKNLLNSLLTP
jgi:AsmA protein